MISRGRGVTLPTHSPCCAWLRSFTDLSLLSKVCPKILACCHLSEVLGISTTVRSFGWDFTLDQSIPNPWWLRSTCAGQDICVSASPLPVHCVSIFIPSGRGYFSLAICPPTSRGGALRCSPTRLTFTQGRSRRASLGDALPPLLMTTEIFLETPRSSPSVSYHGGSPLKGGWLDL